MPNNYFMFKKFTVQQEYCAMKVCTDTCLFGAWLAEKNNNLEAKDLRVLDIGTGTGLLSLMIAQKIKGSKIDAAEIDEPAAIQAAANFEASPWKEHLTVYHTSIQHFNRSTNQHYNLIICNPPFFENDLKSNDDKRNIALHDGALTLEELLSIIDARLCKDGNFAVLLPYHRTVFFELLAAERKLYLKEKVLVKQTPTHNYFRSMLLFCRQKITASEKEIAIKNVNNIYSAEFTTLLKDYYLNL